MQVHVVMVHRTQVGKESTTEVFPCLEKEDALSCAYKHYVEVYEPVRDVEQRHVCMITDYDDYEERLSRKDFEKELLAFGQLLLSDHDLDAHIYISYATNELKK